MKQNQKHKQAERPGGANTTAPGMSLIKSDECRWKATQRQPLPILSKRRSSGRFLL